MPITVLLTGETGTGKSMLASHIHACSSRRHAHFISVNCGAIPQDLMESVLFGHKRGAFSSAHNDKKGLFEATHGGTLFLDEVSEMSLAMQVKLLHVLQDKQTRPVGDTNSRRIDVRIIAATNRDLLTEVEKQTFREDLYHRLSAFPLHIPPLRERPEDIPVLAKHCLEKYTTLLNKPIEGFSPTALQYLQTYPFPGNIRELENMIERAVILNDTHQIELHDLSSLQSPITSGVASTISTISNPNVTLADLEWEYIVQVIKSHHGRLGLAAQILGISRTTLWRRMKQSTMPGTVTLAH